MAVQDQLKGWGQGWTQITDPPRLTDQQWAATSVLGVILIVMAILQLIGFSGFRDWLDSVGFGAPAVWAVIIPLAELWAAAGLFRLRLPAAARTVSAWLAILVGGFWFIETLRLVSEGAVGQLTNSGLFGQYLSQSPGWWTVVEVTALLFWVVYSLKLTKSAWAR